MKTKICSKCKEELSVDLFSANKTRKDGLSYTCKACQRTYQKNHYKKNVSQYTESNKKHRNSRRKVFYEWMKSKSCVDCGNSDIRVLEFDHINREDKSFNISTKVSELSFETLMKEIEKCEIVCANCHKIRTAGQFNWYSFMNEE